MGRNFYGAVSLFRILTIFLFFMMAEQSLGHTNSKIDRSWNLNDVSYLWPLPDVGPKTIDLLLSTQASGNRGVLLPKEVFKLLPALHISGPTNEFLYDVAMRVVAMRVDPCPPKGVGHRCQPELRLIWQPVMRILDTDQWEAKDSAIHSFYRLTAGEFEHLKRQLWEIKQANIEFGIDTSYVPLYVHPAFRNKLRRKEFNSELQALVLQNCGEDNLVQVTFTAEFVEAMWWRFGGFERTTSNRWQPFVIPRLNDTIEDVFNIASEEGPLAESGQQVDTKITVLPEDYPSEDNLLPMVDRDLRFNDDRDLKLFSDKLDAVARFGNPLLIHSRNADCAGCHYADPAHIYALNRFPQLKKRVSQFDYENPEPERFNLSNLTSRQRASRMLRIFGYLHEQPVVAQRVINDSVESARLMSISDNY